MSTAYQSHGARISLAETAVSERTAHIQKIEKFHSAHLDADRDLVVYLPPGYEADPQKRFPILYLHDGQNLFDPTTSFMPGQDWRVGETADELILTGMLEPLIIVGIYNTGKKRIDEYTPTPVKKIGGGQADAYGRMLVEELKPFLDARFRTVDDPSKTGLGGSSLGGLVSMYLGMKYPHVFGKLAVMSPSVWWDHKAILDMVAETLPRPRLKIWLDIGSAEDPRAVRDAAKLRDVLVERGWKLGHDLQYLEAEGATHTESAWAERVAPMLQFLFPSFSAAVA